ncbi:MAG: DUF1254 domain-containing protein [Alphaproteobacteria bacterium]|nr:DUF1254 domain-containing protein [Alphaproteobacteria bacterium]MCW5743280.1 DUF1254 domain-containing protein [Alphaproteobacteria bacterium]
MISRRAAIAGVAAATLARPALGRSGLRALTDLARRAAIYAVPIYQIYRRRWRETVDSANPRLLMLNRLDHATMPSPAAPDMLASDAWLDLTDEPMFLSLPDMGGRAYCFAVVDMFGDTIDQVSRRHYGGRSPPHVLFGPAWTNPPPWDVRAIHATSNLVRLIGRIAIDDTGDIVAARALQAKVLLETPGRRNERRMLESRELMPAGTAVQEELIASWPQPSVRDPWDLLAVAARVLGEGPVPARDTALVANLAGLRLRPGRRFDLLGFTPVERTAMLEGIHAAHAEIDEAARGNRRARTWRLPPRHPGDFGGDRLQRAVVATIDPFMPQSEEAMTLVATADDSGAPLDGARRYEVRFNAAPPTRAFWSLSSDGRLIGGLRRNGDRPVEISVRVRPGPFVLELRIFQPEGGLLDGTWHPPDIVHIQ